MIQTIICDLFILSFIIILSLVKLTIASHALIDNKVMNMQRVFACQTSSITTVFIGVKDCHVRIETKSMDSKCSCFCLPEMEDTCGLFFSILVALYFSSRVKFKATYA